MNAVPAKSTASHPFKTDCLFALCGMPTPALLFPTREGAR